MLGQGLVWDLGLTFVCTQNFVAILRMQCICLSQNILNTVCAMFSYSEGCLYAIIANTAGFICMYKYR